MLNIHRVDVSRVISKSSGEQFAKKRNYNRKLDRMILCHKIVMYDNGSFDNVKTNHKLDTIVELDMDMDMVE